MAQSPSSADISAGKARSSDVEGASRPSRRLLIAALVAWLILTFVLPLGALTFNAISLAGFPLGFWITAQGALAALALLAFGFAWRAGGITSGEGAAPPLNFASEALGAVGLIGFVGAVAALGYDGLAFPLALTAGLALMAMFISPRFVLYPVRSLGGFFTLRYGGVWPRRLALLIAGAASVLLLAADLRGAALVLQALLHNDYALSIAIATVAVAIIWIVKSFVTARSSTSLIYFALLASFAVFLFSLAVPHSNTPIPYLAYGTSINDLSALEQKLVADKLSDIKSLRPMSSPFLQLSMMNFAGLILALALGVAALPHLLGRYASRGAVLPGDAAQRGAIATGWVAVVLMGVAAFAVFARLGVGGVIAKGVETTVVPETIGTSRALGWVDVCSATVTSAPDIAAACAKAPGQRGFLRVQDLAFSHDGFVLSAPMLTELPWALVAPFWVALLIAALATGYAIVAGYLEASGETRQAPQTDGASLQPKTIMLAASLMLAASFVAAVSGLQISELASEGLALIAAGLFPALLLGLYWRGMTASGAVAAMLTGFAISALYIFGVRLFPVQMFEWTGHLSNAAPGAVRKFESLQVALVAAETDDARGLAASALRRHAATMANWWGLRPAAIVLIALPVAFLAGTVVAIIDGRRGAQAGMPSN